jgi:hypothetical protein
MTIFLAFAVCYPDMQVMLYFIIPIKMKWMAIVYAALVAYSALVSGWVVRVAILASMLNFLIFFLMTRNYRGIDPRERARQARWKAATGMGSTNSGMCTSMQRYVMCRSRRIRDIVTNAQSAVVPT